VTTKFVKPLATLLDGDPSFVSSDSSHLDHTVFGKKTVYGNWHLATS
jgi:hypothetical protein